MVDDFVTPCILKPEDYHETITTNQVVRDGLSDLINARSGAHTVAQLIAEEAGRIELELTRDSAIEMLRDVQLSIFRIAFCTPVAHPYLADFLGALQERQEELVQEGIFQDIYMEEGDLFSYIFSAPEESFAFVNFSTFEAHLWQRVGPEAVRDFSFDPLWVFSHSIESAVLNHGPQSEDAWISASTMWLIHAGPSIWELCTKTAKATTDKPFHGDLWSTGDTGYSLARWTFWLERFEAIAKGDVYQVSTETRRYAQSATMEMKRLQATQGNQ